MDRNTFDLDNICFFNDPGICCPDLLPLLFSFLSHKPIYFAHTEPPVFRILSAKSLYPECGTRLTVSCAYFIPLHHEFTDDQSHGCCHYCCSASCCSCGNCLCTAWHAQSNPEHVGLFDSLLDISGVTERGDFEMFTKKMSIKCLAIALAIVITMALMGARSIRAQYWAAIPPYNTLWPLWSPVLSPVSAKTGVPTPLVTSLTPKTILPVQPGLTWDPSFGYPWLLYNSTIGLAYWDQLFGFNPWPPDHLFDPVLNQPIPITLTGNWASLPPTPFAWGAQWVPVANTAYLNYPYAVSPIGTLLTALQIWGL